MGGSIWPANPGHQSAISRRSCPRLARTLSLENRGRREVAFTGTTAGVAWHFGGPDGPVSVDVKGPGSHAKFGGPPRGRIVRPWHWLCPDLAFHRRSHTGRLTLLLHGYDRNPSRFTRSIPHAALCRKRPAS